MMVARKELQMDVLFDRVAGLDVGKASVTVCVRTPGPDGRRSAETRTFSTMTRSLEFMADWLVECGVRFGGGVRVAHWCALGFGRRGRLPFEL